MTNFFHSKFDLCSPDKIASIASFSLHEYCADALAGTLNLLGILLKSPNVDVFAVSAVFSVGRSRPTFPPFDDEEAPLDYGDNILDVEPLEAV